MAYTHFPHPCLGALGIMDVWTLIRGGGHCHVVHRPDALEAATLVYATVPVDGRAARVEITASRPLVSSASSLSGRDTDSSPCKKKNCSLHDQEFCMDTALACCRARRRMIFYCFELGYRSLEIMAGIRGVMRTFETL